MSLSEASWGLGRVGLRETWPSENTQMSQILASSALFVSGYWDLGQKLQYTASGGGAPSDGRGPPLASPVLNVLPCSVDTSSQVAGFSLHGLPGADILRLPFLFPVHLAHV